MQRTALFKRAWSTTWHYKALWAISLFGSVAYFVFEVLYHPLPPFEESIEIIESLFVIYAAVPVIVSFSMTAFVSGALINLVNSISSHEAVTLGGGFRAGLRWMLPLTLTAIILMLPVWLMLYNPIGTLLTVFGNQFASPDSIQVTSLLNQSRFILGSYGLILIVTLVTNAIGIGAERSIVLEGRVANFLVQAVFTVFVSSVWTLAFREWRAQERSALSVAPE